MAIDYRKEVDSGFDKKRLVEATAIALLKAGIPTKIIIESPEFNIKHIEMLKNLEKGYIDKEMQILDKYGGYSKELSEQIVPDIYSDVSHPIGGELYPMNSSEEREKFAERDRIIEQIEILKKQEFLRLEQEKNKLTNDIENYKLKFPNLKKICEALNDMNNLSNGGNQIDYDSYVKILNKYGLSITEIRKYDQIYLQYKKLNNSLINVELKLNNALRDNILTEEIDKLSDKKNTLEDEIIKRNTKLVNGFIRQKYRSLLVESDVLFQICYVGLWKAVKAFDYKRENKFSTFAYKYMDSEVKRNFIELTGLRWERYWRKKKIETLLKTTSLLLGRKVTVVDLSLYGLLDMDLERAKDYIKEEYSFSDLSPVDVDSYKEYETDIQYDLFFGDDEVEDYELDKIDDVVYDDTSKIFNSELRENLYESLSTLNEKERLVIIYRFGLEDGKCRTLSEVGKILGVNRERIRQIEAKALRHLRHPSRLNRLSSFLDLESTKARSK